jgi:transposase
MGSVRALNTQTYTTIRWQRSSATIESRNSQWNILDSSIRCALERSPGEISTLSNLSPTISILGAYRNPSHDLRNSCQRLAPTRQVRSFRVLHRRDLYGGEKRGFGIGKTKRGKGTKLMAVADGAGLPLAVHATSASPHEVTLVLDTLKERFFRQRPARLIGDRAYDSDPLDAALAKQNIELIAPHKFNRRKEPTQDGRSLRRYKRRWKIERLFAWLHNYRRILVRHDYYLDNFLGFVYLACSLILMRGYF